MVSVEDSASSGTILGVYIGLALSIIFVFVCLWRRRAPRYNEVAVILLGAVGIVIGLDFGHTVVTADASALGSLKEHRLAMILGALAVFWTACESLVAVYRKALQAPFAPQNPATADGPSPPLRGSAGR